jgi:hypothetical protein
MRLALLFKQRVRAFAAIRGTLMRLRTAATSVFRASSGGSHDGQRSCRAFTPTYAYERQHRTLVNIRLRRCRTKSRHRRQIRTGQKSAWPRDGHARWGVRFAQENWDDDQPPCRSGRSCGGRIIAITGLVSAACGCQRSLRRAARRREAWHRGLTRIALKRPQVVPVRGDSQTALRARSPALSSGRIVKAVRLPMRGLAFSIEPRTGRARYHPGSPM